MQDLPVHLTESAEYMRLLCIIRSLIVVNDCAERSIKDMTEFVNYAKDVDSRNRAVMIAQHHRQHIDFSNRTKQQFNVTDIDDFISDLIKLGF